MSTPRLYRIGSLVVLAGVVGCSDSPLVAPLGPPTSASLAASGTAGSDEPTKVIARLGEIGSQVGTAKSKVVRAELLMSDRWNGVTSTLIFANDRVKGIGLEWVKGDPRRDGNPGVTYQNASALGVLPFVINPDRATISQTTLGVLDAQIEEAMSAWRGLSCSSKPITRVAIPAGSDPSQLDNFFSGIPLGPNYVQTADIVQGGWQTPQFFRNIAAFFGDPPASGDAILAITFSFAYQDAAGNPTDIDRNKKGDLGLSEIYYNAGFVWDNSALLDLRVIDFFSVIAHESGHGLGLGHLGKIFVTKKDAADGISLSEVKFAPRALMNAAYFGGRDEIRGTDKSQFCQIWASK